MSESFEATAGLAPQDRITASALDVEERVINVPGETDSVAARGGTLLLHEDGQPKATASFTAYTREQPSYMPERAVIFVRNGGPSAPTTTGNALIFGGPFIVNHDTHGRIDPAEDLNVGSADDTLFQYADVVYLDPVGTGLGTTLPETDPTWPYDAQTEADVFAAAVKWWRRTYGKQNIGIVVSSFGVYAGIGAALNLEESGVPISGLGIISGAYREYERDYSISRPDNRPNSFSSFIFAMPMMAVAAQYHGKLSPEFSDMAPEALHDMVLAFAKEEYTGARLARDKDPLAYEKAVQKMSQFIGLPVDIIMAQQGLIDPDFFRTTLLPGKVLSVMDVRDAYDATTTYEVDPALDVWWRKYNEAIHSSAAGTGYPESFRQGTFQPAIRMFDSYRFTGIWRYKEVGTALAKLLNLRPDMRILAISGLYDPIRPAPGTDNFWQEMRMFVPKLDIRYFEGTAHDIRPVSRAPGVERFRLRMGHQFTRHDKATRIGRSALSRFAFSLSPRIMGRSV